MRVFCFVCVLGCAWAGTLHAESADEWFDRQTDWHGFDQLHFRVADRSAWLVVPNDPLPERPWIWRARFPGYHDEIDVALVKQGFHLAYVDVAGLFGNLQAMHAGDAMYTFLTEQRGLAKQPVLEGVSRGGLFVYHWLMRHPTNVACVYCDTPVLDIASWPGGKGTGLGSERDWSLCRSAWNLSEAEATDFRKGPLHRAAPIIAKQGIPVLHIVSENDVVVPPSENSYVLRDQLRKSGHEMLVISVAEGTAQSHGHHFDHPAVGQVIRFITEHGVQREN